MLRAAVVTEKPARRALWKRILSWGLYVLAVLVFICGSLEVILRIWLNYNPSYYVGFSDAKDRTVHYPYGDIKFNSLGFPDDEFDATKKRPRIAYIGDSICFGVGAGYGYRMTELFDKSLPEYEHMNMSGGVGSNGVNDRVIAKLNTNIDRFQIDEVVYVLNLNDVLPDEGEEAGPQLGLASYRRSFEWLRAHSYLFNYVRTLYKNWAMRKGYGHTGQIAFEFYPQKYADVFRAAAKRVLALAAALAERRVGFVVVIVPYEMQISADAERKYKELGFDWEADFVDRGAQKALIDLLPGVEVVDAYYAFVDPARGPEYTRERNGVGQYFVYNAGDRIDWNHPNRAGHARLADYVLRSGVLVKYAQHAGRPGATPDAGQ